MKKALVPIIVLVVIFLGIFMYSVGIKNDIVTYSQKELKQWADVEAAYQRRNDLIPNLVKSVKGVANYEKGTLEAVVNARAKATSINIDPSNITPEQFQEFQKAQAGVSSALSKLLMVTENYPELKADAHFLKLEDELASTENTIQTQRIRYNAAIQEYNTFILKFPNSMFAGMYGYHQKPFFAATEGAEIVPEINF